MFITRAVVIAAVVFASVFLGAAGAARNPDAPVMSPIDETFVRVVTDLCAFPVTVESHVEGTLRFYLDRQTDTLAAINIAVTETDTFIANGNTIVSDPFAARNRLVFDPEGNVTETLHGLIEKITLPDGTTFVSAGRASETNGEPRFIIGPEVGHTGDVDALCAALAA